MNILEWTLLGICLFIIVMYLVLGFIVSYHLFFPKRNTLENSRKIENDLSPGLMDLYDSWEKNAYQIETKNGYNIMVYDILPSMKTDKFVVIAHGYTYTHHGSIKYAKMFINLGYHVILFDQRFHGSSGGKYCTLGGLEKYDLYDVITHVFEKYGKDIYLGTFGESMGSSTVLLEQELDSRIQFVGSDCGFSSLELLVTYLTKRKLHLPSWPLINIANLYFHLFTKISLEDVSPLDSVLKARVPIFYAHGLDDLYILPFHTQVLYDSTKTDKALFWGENHSRHAEAARKNENEYFKALKEFITNTENLNYHK